MPILSADIKLLKSAVMADTTDGGGAMTGAPISTSRRIASFGG